MQVPVNREHMSRPIEAIFILSKNHFHAQDA